MEIFTTATILLLLLGHDDFRTREEAEQQLKGMGVLALPVLDYGAKSKDIEVVSRVNRLRRSIWLSAIDKMDMPWVDCLSENKNSAGQIEWPDNYTISHYYLSVSCRDGHSNTGPEWKSYREATRLLCKDMIYNGSSLENVKEILEAMWIKHNTFNEKTGRYETPPEQIGAPTAKKE